MKGIDEGYILENFDKAMEDGAVKAYIQPVIRTLTGKICGCEMLARWENPEFGVLSPFIFINALEKHRLIYKLDLYILEYSCRLYNWLISEGVDVVPFSEDGLCRNGHDRNALQRTE